MPLAEQYRLAGLIADGWLHERTLSAFAERVLEWVDEEGRHGD